MSWVTEHRHHRDEADPCTARDRDDIHLTLKCEDCDVFRMSRMTLEQVTSMSHQGRITQDDLEAYDYVWTLLSPYRGTPAAPEQSDVRRIARKLLRSRSFEVPADLAG